MLTVLSLKVIMKPEKSIKKMFIRTRLKVWEKT